MPVSVRQAAKEQAIKDEYAELAKKRIYSRTYIIDLLANKYYLLDNTIERIVWGEYDARRRREEVKRSLLGKAA
jgi:hypothetical protein